MLISWSFFGQETAVNTTVITPKMEYHSGCDVSLFMAWAVRVGNYVAVQPTIEYNVNPKLKFDTWATHNFQKDYFYEDGTSYKGYQEIDFFVKYLSIQKIFAF